MSRQYLSVALAALSATALLLASGGCHEDTLVENHHFDDPYIRLPGQTENKIKVNSGELFPLHKGDQWNILVQTGDRRSTEQVVDTGPIDIGGVTGYVFELRQNGKAYREEIYRNDPANGIELVASGTVNDLMVMVPPIPLFHEPAVDGDTVAWSGILHFKNTSSPGTAMSRVTGRNVVSTAAGQFNTFRIDTMITTTINEQPAAFPMKRWLAPGVGVVQQQMIAGNAVLTKQLHSYTVAKN